MSEEENIKSPGDHIGPRAWTKFLILSKIVPKVFQELNLCIYLFTSDSKQGYYIGLELSLSQPSLGLQEATFKIQLAPLVTMTKLL